MRLDKFISQTANQSRAQSRSLIKSGRVRVNQTRQQNPGFQIHPSDTVYLNEKLLSPLKNQYILLYKPTGYICSTQDEIYPSALSLLTGVANSKLHFAGRLDVDTTGLVLITDDGQWSHQVTSPRKQCSKTYRVSTKVPLTELSLESLRQGVLLQGEKTPTLPAEVILLDETNILLTIQEGRYHQVKRMLAAVNNRVIALHREKVGAITLDGLEISQWRHLTSAEIASFMQK
ncbi:pseudouridine synthase [Aliikangiella maris]|uniref:Pseudouridine synthase n=2 Tax=Aliikangiella maris TaxID=3162458 RepID=A0ABV2BP62_9GAMM